MRVYLYAEINSDKIIKFIQDKNLSIPEAAKIIEIKGETFTKYLDDGYFRSNKYIKFCDYFKVDYSTFLVNKDQLFVKKPNSVTFRNNYQQFINLDVENLYKILNKTSLSIWKISPMLGKSQGYLNQCIRTTRIPKDYYIKLCDILNVNYSELSLDKEHVFDVCESKLHSGRPINNIRIYANKLREQITQYMSEHNISTREFSLLVSSSPSYISSMLSKATINRSVLDKICVLLNINVDDYIYTEAKEREELINAKYKRQLISKYINEINYSLTELNKLLPECSQLPTSISPFENGIEFFESKQDIDMISHQKYLYDIFVYKNILFYYNRYNTKGFEIIFKNGKSKRVETFSKVKTIIEDGLNRNLL